MIRFILDYFYEWYSKPSRSRRQVSLPTVLNLPITDNCNARCVMCNVWKNNSSNEVSSQELAQILQNPLYRKVKHVGISGGEPTLRSDLIDVVLSTCSTLPALRSISITSHGFHPKRWEKMLPEIKRICAESGIAFTLNLSLDGIEEIHDSIRRIPGGYKRVMESYEIARFHNVQVKFQTTVSKQNIFHVGRILQKVRDELKAGFEIRLATEINRLNNLDVMGSIALNENEKSFLADFLLSDDLMTMTLSPARRLFYRDLVEMLINNSHRKAPCYYQNEGLLLTAHGEMYHCSISEHLLGNAEKNSSLDLYYSENSQRARSQLIQKTCQACMHDQSGAWDPWDLVRETISQTNFGKLIFKDMRGLNIIARSLYWKAQVALIRQRLPSVNSPMSTVLCVGMYGGEHVGDAAILGGVLLRVFAQHGVRHAYVASIRPHRTRRWLKSLNLPVDVTVLSYDEAKSLLATFDGVIHAGGPIMDLPDILAKQLEIAVKCIHLKKPYIVEGVGIGPLKNWYSRWIARSLLQLATLVTLRTDDKNDSILRGINYRVVPDPAFDYLKTRGDLVISAVESAQINKITSDKTDAFLIGINLRPFWNKYTGKENSKMEEIRFLQRFASTLVDAQNKNAGKLEFVFFPMNSDQFGFSDLSVAYYLKNFLPEAFPFQIWEIEPDIDTVLYLLRQMDACITMRFHASIFSLSQGLPTFGLDYSYHGAGKVAKLFADVGKSDFVSPVSQYNSDQVINFLSNLQAQKLYLV